MIPPSIKIRSKDDLVREYGSRQIREVDSRVLPTHILLTAEHGPEMPVILGDETTMYDWENLVTRDITPLVATSAQRGVDETPFFLRPAEGKGKSQVTAPATLPRRKKSKYTRKKCKRKK